MGKNNHLLLEPKMKKANAASLREEMANLREEMANLREEMPRTRVIVLARGERLSSQLRVLMKLREVKAHYGTTSMILYSCYLSNDLNFLRNFFFQQTNVCLFNEIF